VNGPSHYVKGEELAERAEGLFEQGDLDGLAPVWVALAQVHATLAEAAAAALGTLARRGARVGGRRTDQLQRPRPATWDTPLGRVP
jgi:hypothetical protein